MPSRNMARCCSSHDSVYGRTPPGGNFEHIVHLAFESPVEVEAVDWESEDGTSKAACFASHPASEWTRASVGVVVAAGVGFLRWAPADSAA